MNVTFHPEPGASDVTEQYGYEFAGGKPVNVTNERHLMKFRGNPFFKVEGAGAEAAPVATPAATPTAPVEPSPTAEPLVAVHRGRGSYSVMRGDKELKQGLDKAEADAFNTWSDDDKAAFAAS